MKRIHSDESIKNAVTYPVIMIFMLLLSCSSCLRRYAYFESVYEQLGARLSPVSIAATRLGAYSAGGSYCRGSSGRGGFRYLAHGKRRQKIQAAQRMMDRFKRKSRIALAVANRRFTSVLALTLHSGLELEKGHGAGSRTGGKSCGRGKDPRPAERNWRQEPIITAP